MSIGVSENFSGRMLLIVSGAWVARRTFTVVGVGDPGLAIGVTGVAHGSPHPDNFNLYCASRQAAAGKGPLIWIVTADYRFGDVGLGAPSPTQELTKILPDVDHESMPIEWDLDKAAVVNSAGDPYDPPDTRFVPVATFIFRRAMPFYDLQVALNIVDHVNDGTVQIGNFGSADDQQAYCHYYRPCEAYTAAAPYVFVEAKISVKGGTKPWQPRRVDAGRFGWYNDPDGHPQKGRICTGPKDSGGVPVDFDVRLNGKGKPLDEKWFVQDSASLKAADPVENPTVPDNIDIDKDLSDNKTIVVLIGKQIPTADMSSLFD